MTDSRHMQEFWDARARENALYFIDNTVDYTSPDADEFWASGERSVDAILELLGARIEGHEELVEVGCGIGRITRALAARAKAVVAIDISAQMLEQAKEVNPGLDNVRWLHGEGTSLAGVDDASVDGLFSHVVFQHIPDPEVTYSYVRDMGRVLRPGGWAAFQVSNDPRVHRPRQPLRERLGAIVGRGPRGQSDPAWLGSAVDLDRLRAAAEGAGLGVEKIVGAGTQFCYVLLRRRS
jgi:SAM-dependent methyltransferase